MPKKNLIGAVPDDDHYLNCYYCYDVLKYYLQRLIHHHLSPYNQWTVDDLIVVDGGDDGEVVVLHDENDGDFVEVQNIY